MRRVIKAVKSDPEEVIASHTEYEQKLRELLPTMIAMAR